jgi:hypothetical protein
MAYRSILTVVTPAPDRSLVDLATVKDEFDITVTTTDARLQRWITESSNMIGQSVGRAFRAETVAEVFRASVYRNIDAPGERFFPARDAMMSPVDLYVPALQLVRFPIVSVTSIIEDGTTLDPAVDYELYPNAGLIYRLSGSNRTNWFADQITITYTGGYVALTDVPSDLQLACMTLLRYRLGGKSRDPLLRQESVPGVLERQYTTGQASSASGLPPDVEALVGHYRGLSL